MAQEKILICDDEQGILTYLKKLLMTQGFAVETFAGGSDLLRRLREGEPSDAELLLQDVRMPDMDGIEAASRIYQDGAVPVILVSAFHDADFIRRAEADHILAYLVKPIKQADLEPAIAIATRRFEQFEALRKEAADLRQALEDRKTIEKAKGLLMKKLALDEHDAFRRLQKLASDKNLKLVELSRMLITAEEAFGGAAGGKS